ncbi:MAG TPA: FprA family A-type flavoprotein, partial [Candidatus Methanofastidiosum sp.]|nr:FprA family A-type flavoprotein [Methanofastidiosum sp.]
MKASKLKDGVFWVGAIDWNPPNFGYSLSKGTAYNSYLILDEKTALIDTVKHGFT